MNTSNMTYFYNPESLLNWDEFYWSRNPSKDFGETKMMEFDSDLFSVAASHAPSNCSHQTNILQHNWPQGSPSQSSPAETGESLKPLSTANQPQALSGREKR